MSVRSMRAERNEISDVRGNAIEAAVVQRQTFHKNKT